MTVRGWGGFALNPGGPPSESGLPQVDGFDRMHATFDLYFKHLQPLCDAKNESSLSLFARANTTDRSAGVGARQPSMTPTPHAFNTRDKP